MQTQLLTARTEVLAARIEVLAALRQWPVVERRAGAAMASVTVPLSRVCLGRCKIISTVRGAAAFLPEVDGFSTAEVPVYDVSASRRRAGSCQRQVHHCGAGAVKLPCRLPLHRRLLSGRNQHLRPGYQQLHLRRPDLCV